MIDQNWCPYEAAEAPKTFSSRQTCSLLHSIRKPIVKESDANCSRERCEKIEVDSTYKVKHITGPDFGCKLLSLDTGEVAAILRTPCLSLLGIQRQQGSDSFSMKLVASISNTPYAAPSHVWADGPRNPEVNALLMCRINELAKIILKDMQLELKREYEGPMYL